MNKSDSELLAGILDGVGGQVCPEPSEADLLLLNTCSVREHAEQRVFGKLGELKRLKADRPGMKIAVCGCMAESYGDRLMERAPHIDFIVGTESQHLLPDLLLGNEAANVAIGRRDIPESSPLKRSGSSQAWVTVIRGCDNYCSYCIVPYLRGPQRSRSSKSIVAEVQKLSRNGCREITLLGQNVNSYGVDLALETDFAGLLKEVSSISGIDRVRFATSHPKDVSQRLIDALADIPEVCEQLHLPLQAGDDEVLRRMKRGYVSADYRRLVERVRDRVPNVVLSTDIIVGFPGETEAAYRKTLSLVKAIGFDQAFMFYFSPRTGTEAAGMADQLPVQVRKERLAELISLQNAITLEINRSQVGSTEEVLLEGKSRKDDGHVFGRTRGGKTVLVKGNESECVGKLCKVKLEKAYLWGFKASPTED